MNVARILAQLKAERRRLNVAIAALERLVEAVQKPVQATSKRAQPGRKRRSPQRKSPVQGNSYSSVFHALGRAGNLIRPKKPKPAGRGERPQRLKPL